MSVIYPGSERSTLEFIADAVDWLEYSEATGTLYTLMPGDGTPCVVVSAPQIYQATLRSMLRPVSVLRTCPLCNTWWNNPDSAYPGVEVNCPDCGNDQRRLPVVAGVVQDPECATCREVLARRRSDDLHLCLACGYAGFGSQAAPSRLHCKECKQTCSFSGIGREVACQMCSKHRYKIKKRTDCDLCALEREVRIADSWCGACGSPGTRP